MLNWEECSSVERDIDRMSGAWVFKGTRIPVEALFENLEDGATIDEFIESASLPSIIRFLTNTPDLLIAAPV